MTVGEVLAKVPLRSELPAGLSSAEVLGLDYDSRRVEPGYLFFAFAGSRVDGREFAAQAAAKGALAVVSDLEAPAAGALPWIQVEHGRHALALAAEDFLWKPR